MKLQRLLALSSTAVIAAACSSGGSSVAPHAVQNAGGTGASAVKHAPNAKLTLKFPANFARLKKTAAAAARQRKPSFVDPGTGSNLIAVQVSNSSNEGNLSSYMATTASTVAGGSQAIPLYLAPGYDTITVQEYDPEYNDSGYLLSQYSGYLLAQGQVSQSISDGGTNNLGVTMELVMASQFTNYSYSQETSYPAAGVAVITDTNYDTTYPAYVSPSYNFGTQNAMCVNPGTTLFFVPVDEEYGFENPFQGADAGNTQANTGIPLPVISAVSENGGTSSLVSSPLGYYSPAFDGENDPIDVTISFPNGSNAQGYQQPGALVDPSPWGPFSGLTPGGSVLTQVVYPSSYTYYATIQNNESCTNIPPESHARRPGEAVVRKAPPKG